MIRIISASRANTSRANKNERQRLKRKGISRTNWAALDAADDDSIDYSDIPSLTDDFFENATLIVPASQAERLIQIEPDVLRRFQSKGKGYKMLINWVLRRYTKSSE